MTNLVFCDIETDGLNPSVIWCAVCRHNGVSEVICNEKDFKDYVQRKAEATFVFHNGIGFDVPVVERLWNFTFDRSMVTDTLVLSRLAEPSRSGGHSLRNWGNILGFPKGDHEDWSQLSPAMIDYCIRDTEVTEAVYNRLTVELDGFSKESQDLEHQVQWIIQDQERNGWLLDQRLCHILCAKFKERMNEIESDLQALFPPIVEERYSEKTGKRLKDKVTVFNVGSRQQVAERLSAKGAVWTELTPTGKPMVDEKTLKENNHVPEAAQVLEYLLLQKRYAQVNSWLEHVQDDGRVHGRVTTNGAVTGRMTHQSPNMAQVPSVNSEYGEDCRNCWIVPEGRKLVGVDASGLELRMLAHYMGDEEFTNVLLRDDIHTRNQTAAGLATRPQAKTFIYAFLYGAGDAKIGSIVGGTARDGNELRTRFLRNTPALETLRERVGQASRKGYLRGLDGRKLWVRSEHSALNTLLQAAGAIIMKRALVLLDDYATQHGIDYKFVGNVHDEIQSEVASEQAEKFGWLAVECIKAAGISFELRCPLDGEYQVGTTWADTH
jgi:DNA polymerase I-like protein with 3'-5' exonuclease and polymerase domains